MGKKENINKVVLAYSGGLDTSVILKWLQETYDCDHNHKSLEAISKLLMYPVHQSRLKPLYLYFLSFPLVPQKTL